MYKLLFTCWLTTACTSWAYAQGEQPSDSTGYGLFQKYCALCHGKEGKGDGRLSSLIVNPPPANLTESTKQPEYLRQIILNGGAFVDRSPQMPAWTGTLSGEQVDLVIEHLLTIRESRR